MPYVPDKLVSPLSTAVLAYITNTDASWQPEGRGKYSKANLQEIWNRVKLDLKNARKLGRAHRHSIHNRFCAEEIAKNTSYLMDQKNVFITSLSSPLKFFDSPRIMCVTLFSQTISFISSKIFFVFCKTL